MVEWVCVRDRVATRPNASNVRHFRLTGTFTDIGEPAVGLDATSVSSDRHRSVVERFRRIKHSKLFARRSILPTGNLATLCLQ